VATKSLDPKPFILAIDIKSNEYTQIHMMKTYHFCNNCGKQGHLFNQCKKPIISIGIIIFKEEDHKIKYLMICRKDSIGYIEFLRGKYPLYNKDYIQKLIDQMSVEEKKRLLYNNFNNLWANLWGDFSNLQYRNEEKHSRQKFEQIKKGIKILEGGEYNLETLIRDSQTLWATPEWGFPKGRRNYQESDLTCALREFEEETGYLKTDISLLKNIVPFEEIFMGSNYKSYKHKYYLGKIEPTTKAYTDYQKSEVSKVAWFDLDQCIENIRPYHLEKMSVLRHIHHVLQGYRLIL